MQSSRLSIVHVVVTLERGGLERLVTDLAIEQLKAGHQVAVFSLNATEGYAQPLADAGIEVVIGHKRGGYDFGTISSLRRLIQARQADVVHTHNFVPNYYAATAMLGLGRKVGLVCTCHDMGTRLSDRKLRTFFKLSVLRTNRVAMVGSQVHAHFVQSGHVPAAKADTVLNAVPLERFDFNDSAREKARQALGLAPDALAIGCVGRLVALKNHALMIDLMPRLLQSHPQARLVLIGGGELEQTLRTHAERAGVAAQVIMTGERTQVAELLPGLDVFALPSLTEGVSIALLEACATGLPVLATRVGGNPEIITDGATGLLVPPDDRDATFHALKKLLGEPSLRDRLGQAAREWVRAHASLDALRRRYDALYFQAMGMHPLPGAR